MRKIVFTLLVAALAVPALAQEQNTPQNQEAPAVQMQRDHEAFKKAREEQRAKMKATEEKMEKLVKEYNKLKAGKKKDAKRAEIENEVSAIHEEQLKFKQDQLAKFEERLARMKADFTKENSAEGKAEWVNQKTDALIKADGDLKALFGPRPGPRMGHHGGHHKGFFGKKGPNGPKGPKPDRPDMDND